MTLCNPLHQLDVLLESLVAVHYSNKQQQKPPDADNTKSILDALGQRTELLGLYPQWDEDTNQ